jgi:hypothetical protein
MLRSLGLMTALATIAVVAAAWPGGRRARMGAATVIAAGFAVPLAGYVAVQASQTHRVELTTGTGWALYARVAPFADCREFAPPPGTAGLCEARDARTRPGPDFYAWYPASPAQQHFGHPPQHDDRLGAFARAVIRAQPRAYASAVATDLWRFVVPDAGRDRPARGAGPSELAVDGRVPAQERLNRAAAAPLYATGPAHVRAAAHTLADVQRVVRVHGPLLLAALLLAVLGCLAAPGRRERLALALLVVPGLTSLVLSTALTVYNWRYAVPYLPFLTAGGALGAHVLAGRVRTRIGARTPV